MKNLIGKIAVFAIVAAAPLMQSCLKDKSLDMYYANAIVTVKPLDDGGFYLQLNDEVALLPVNMDRSPYDKEQRAFVNYTPTNEDAGEYDQAVKVNWFREILTKDMVQPAAGTDLDAEYGDDPVEIIASWMTVVEDGYFTIHFETYSSGNGVTHKVNLVQPDPEKPYELEFRHDASGDVYGSRVWSVAAFKLSALELTEGQKVEIKLKWDSYSGEKTHVFEYTPGEALSSGQEGNDPGQQSMLTIE